jgi:outer membrane protein assembly factor BamB
MKWRICVTLWLMLGVCPLMAVADWNHWRGPEQNGISRETNLVDDWSLADNKNVLWVSETGGRAAPIVLNGRVYLSCRTPDDVTDPVEKINAREQVVCWDAATGEVLWRDVFNVFQTDVPAPRVGWASMVGDTETGWVYLHSVSGIFRCYTPDGEVVWERSMNEEFGQISGYGGRFHTPLIDEDRIIISFLHQNWGDSGGPPRHAYYAFDKHNGQLLWVSAPGGRPQDTTYSSPIVTVIDGVRMLIGGNADGGIYAMQARTGEPLWGFRMSRRGLNAAPVVDGNLVYISHGEDNVDTVRFGRIQCIDGTGRGDITETHCVWRVDDIKAGYTGLLVKDGILYVMADTGSLHAFDSKTGEPLWVKNLGTVGRGSPVWADGKIYIMEVNGNIHILRPSREGCETLSHVELRAADGVGTDEIFASPAIADGRIYFVTRDRTICIGAADPSSSKDPVPPLADEKPPETEVALVQLVPFETYVTGDGEIDYQLRAFDKNGRLIEIREPELQPEPDLTSAQAKGSKLVISAPQIEQAGQVIARHGDLTARARLRVFPQLPWHWDFDGFEDKQVPSTWIFGRKLAAADVDDQRALVNVPGPGKPSIGVWLGPPDMSGYTVQADVLMREERRRLASVGLTAQRYNLILKGNNGRLSIQSWPAHLRMAREIRFRSDPDTWYTMKMRVDVKEDSAHVMGKVWKRGDAEPEDWTIETVDPHPNRIGSPGLYIYSLATSAFDNVKVTQHETNGDESNP